MQVSYTRVEIARLFAPFMPNPWAVLEERWARHRFMTRANGVSEWTHKKQQERQATDDKRCRGKTGNGKRCRRDALTNAVFCGMHVVKRYPDR